jgi:hypothetical protein
LRVFVLFRRVFACAFAVCHQLREP